MDAITARQNLDAERRRLTALGRTGRLGSIDHGDVGEEAADLYDREVERALDDEVLAELDQLDHALARLDAGSYGRCEACAAPIPDERLEAVPATRWCLAHETEAELHLGAIHPDDVDDPAELVRAEAQRHLPAGGDDLADPEDPDDRTTAAEDRAVHVHR